MHLSSRHGDEKKQDLNVAPAPSTGMVLFFRLNVLNVFCVPIKPKGLPRFGKSNKETAVTGKQRKIKRGKRRKELQSWWQ